MPSKDDRIRERAHALWLQEGQPSGHEQRHWEQASAEVDAEDAPAAEPAKKATTRKAAAPKKSAATTSGAAPAIAKVSKDAKKAPAKKAPSK